MTLFGGNGAGGSNGQGGKGRIGSGGKAGNGNAQGSGSGNGNRSGAGSENGAGSGSASGKSAQTQGAAPGNREGGSGTPTLADIFDKKTYYSPGKIRSRLTRQLEKYERLLSESEERMAELKLQMMDPALASDYEKLMELQNGLDAEEQTQESLLERMLETETALQELPS